MVNLNTNYDLNTTPLATRSSVVELPPTFAFYPDAPKPTDEFFLKQKKIEDISAKVTKLIDQLQGDINTKDVLKWIGIALLLVGAITAAAVIALHLVFFPAVVGSIACMTGSLFFISPASSISLLEEKKKEYSKLIEILNNPAKLQTLIENYRDQLEWVKIVKAHDELKETLNSYDPDQINEGIAKYQSTKPATDLEALGYLEQTIDDLKDVDVRVFIPRFDQPVGNAKRDYYYNNGLVKYYTLDKNMQFTGPACFVDKDGYLSRFNQVNGQAEGKYTVLQRGKRGYMDTGQYVNNKRHGLSTRKFACINEAQLKY